MDASLTSLCLFSHSWQEQCSLRPSAQEMLAELEALWHGCCHNLVYDTDVEAVLEEPQPIAVALPAQRAPRGKGAAAFEAVSKEDPASTAANIGKSLSSPAVLRPVDWKFALSNPNHPSSKRLMRQMNAKMLNDPEESFMLLQESSGAWLVVTLEEPHLILFASSTWCHTFGYTAPLAQELIGRSVRDMSAVSGAATEVAVLDTFLRSFAPSFSSSTSRTGAAHHDL